METRGYMEFTFVTERTYVYIGQEFVNKNFVYIHAAK